MSYVYTYTDEVSLIYTGSSKEPIIPETLREIEELYDDWRIECRFKPYTLDDITQLHFPSNKIRKIIIPSIFVGLCGIHCEGNELVSLIIPSTLNRLDYLDCSCNKLTELIIPPELTCMRYLKCSSNELIRLVIPTTLVRLTMLYSDGNNLKYNTINEFKQEYQREYFDGLVECIRMLSKIGGRCLIVNQNNRLDT